MLQLSLFWRRKRIFNFTETSCRPEENGERLLQQTKLGKGYCCLLLGGCNI
ncbi:unnamed protein product [Porites lobata]|nr:unnamed protein product [Porites lobata]